MGQILFVVWRESFEALLVIGIIYTWIKRHPGRTHGMKFLWVGVILGLIISVLLALVIYRIFNIFDDTSQSIFMILMEITACILIVQMVFWTKNQAYNIKIKLEKDLNKKIEYDRWWGPMLIVTVAIAREGSEIVVFLSSFIMSLTANNALPFFIETAGGILLAGATLYLFILTNRMFSYKVFFKITSVILLFLALSLLLKGVEETVNLLIEYDYPVPYFMIIPAWDTTNLLDDSKIAGNFVASFFAYRSQPIWLSIITFFIYWLIISITFSRGKKNG